MPHWDLGIRAESVIYIHGIGNKIAAPLLKLEWDHALYTSDLAGQSSMAYWADIRYERPLASNSEQAPPPGETSEEVILDDMSLANEALADILADGPRVDVDDDQSAAEFSSSYLRELMAAESVLSAAPEEQLVDPTKAVPGIIRQPGFWLATKLFLPDAHAYFFNKAQREAIRERLRDRISQAAQPILLVAHSLGSIISYDVLHEERFADLRVAAFITFGSQLGVRAIQDRVRNPLEVPGSVQSGWHNYLDKADLLPMGQLLNPYYRPNAIADHWAENPSPNDHDGVSYLSESRLQAAAYKALPPPA